MLALSAKLLYAGRNEETFERLANLCRGVSEFQISLERAASYENLAEGIFADTFDLCLIDQDLVSADKLLQLELLDTNQRSGSLALIGSEVCKSKWDAWKQDRFDAQQFSRGELLCCVRHALHRQKLRAEVEYRLSYERLANEILSSFVEMKPNEIDPAVVAALEKVGRFAEVKNSFICLFSKDSHYLERTHHWSLCETDLAPCHMFERIDVSQLPWFTNRIRRNCIVSFSERQELISVAPTEEEYFASTDVRALIAVPLQCYGESRGFLGFSNSRDAREWSKEDVELLQLMGRLFINAIERRRSENARKESEERFQTVVESLNDGLVLFDASNRVEFVNDKFVELTGYSQGELASGDSVFRLFLEEEDAARIHQAIESFSMSVEENSAKEFRIQVIRADAQRRWMTISVAPYRQASGKLLGTVIAFRDVTEQHFLEEQLQHAQKMEAVGRLAGGVAHDFNNVLTAVLGYSGLLLNRLPSDHPNRHEILQIRKASEQAGALVQQLLTFSRKQARSPKVLKLNAVITETQPMLSRLVGENVELVADLEPFLCSVRADPSQVQQILLNLVINARDAMPNGGTLTLQTRNSSVPESGNSALPMVPGGDYAMLTVSDTGSGMTPMVKKHLFEPFFTTKDQGKGTGLGLATVYGIVQSSGGQINVQTELGRGTTFRILLPRVLGETNFQPRYSGSEKLRTGTETVLLVEDEESVRSLLSEVLTMSGYRVLEAAHGREAVRCSRKFDEPIDLLITDVVMPHMGGRETAERICRFRKEIKVLVISGYLHDGAAQSQFGPKSCKMLEKPFTPYDFSLAVREALDSSKGKSSVGCTKFNPSKGVSEIKLLEQKLN